MKDGASHGYSGRAIVDKLGIRPGSSLAVVDCPADYDSLVPGLPLDLDRVDGQPASTVDMIHLFVTRAEGLREKLALLRGHIPPAGVIWVSWPKQAARVTTDVTGNVVRAAALEAGLVDVKVCAVDAVWSALKLVIPVAQR